MERIKLVKKMLEDAHFEVMSIILKERRHYELLVLIEELIFYIERNFSEE